MSRFLGKAAAGLAALSLAAAPALAAQSPASKLSLRAATKSKDASDLAGIPVIALIGVAAIVAGAVIIANNDDDDPDSP
jgi:hypothetical protein